MDATQPLLPVREAIELHSRVAVLEERVDGHDQLVKVLSTKMDGVSEELGRFKDTVASSAVTITCAIIGGAVAVIVALLIFILTSS